MSKEKRDRLFKKGRPHFRPLEIYDGDKYHKDIGILWVAYQKNPFWWLPKDLNQASFAKHIEEISSRETLTVADDKNKNFKTQGMVGLITTPGDGWKIEPHVQFMPWATPKNKLRVCVAFFQYIRHQKIGACVAYGLQDSVSLFDKCCDYGVLHRVGKIVNGDPRGDEYVYSVRGRKCPPN